MSQRDNHESYEVFAGRLHWIAAMLVGTLVAIVWLMYVLSRTWLGPPPQAPRGASPPAPRLQPNPHVDLAAHRERERALLESYQWVDRRSGIARIPVERAMQLLAGSGGQPAGGSEPHAASPPASIPTPAAAPVRAAPAIPAAPTIPAASTIRAGPSARAAPPVHAGLPPPKDLYRRAGIDQHLGARVPLHLMFRDSLGRAVTLQQLTHGKPTVLALGYYHCPNLCDMTLQGMGRAAEAMPLKVGGDYEVAFVSIDPQESSADARATATTLQQENPSAHADRWHLLTGSEAAIESLSAAIGYRYFRDERIGQYAHAAGVVVLTGQGLVSQYFFGVSYPPRALRLALVNASSGHLGTILDRLVLLCCAYDPSTGRYSFLIGRITQALAVTFLLVAAGGWFVLHRRTRR
ncbi:MAG TPA: SCO family protein [Steroidobacteraceae bacterium]|nr:SCO family protein [Steroidobacteraceae bacterium]